MFHNLFWWAARERSWICCSRPWRCSRAECLCSWAVWHFVSGGLHSMLPLIDPMEVSYVVNVWMWDVNDFWWTSMVLNEQTLQVELFTQTCWRLSYVSSHHFPCKVEYPDEIGEIYIQFFEKTWTDYHSPIYLTQLNCGRTDRTCSLWTMKLKRILIIVKWMYFIRLIAYHITMVLNLYWVFLRRTLESARG